MAEYTYKISGNITYNGAYKEDGFETVEIDEVITIEEMSAEKAIEIFLEENEQYDFFGSIKSFDAETRGGKWAEYKDKNEGQRIIITLND